MRVQLCDQSLLWVKLKEEDAEGEGLLSAVKVGDAENVEAVWVLRDGVNVNVKELVPEEGVTVTDVEALRVLVAVAVLPGVAVGL